MTSTASAEDPRKPEEIRQDAYDSGYEKGQGAAAQASAELMGKLLTLEDSSTTPRSVVLAVLDAFAEIRDVWCS